MSISKKMLINVMHPEEARVAIVHEGRLMELNIEISGKEQTKGNIYKGVVLRVEPGLQAAFIDTGQKKSGFLQMGELHPDFWQWRDDIPEENRKRRPRIQEVLRRGQELVVQVEKDERDHKGAALTSYLSLPGRYMVIMPGSDSTGISRKIERDGERKRLKEQIAEMTIPEGIGYIIRTEAVGRTTEELQKDLDSLVDMYREIMRRADETKGAGEIYQDSGLILRTIRDYFSEEVDEILVDNKDAYRQAQEFLDEIQPGYGKRVKLHKEKRPIFSKFQLEEQIDQIYEKRVSLPSGGSLIIEPTEALVSIDVNSGKSSGERGVEDTAFKTNMEAAEEVARQLRLRDLGGLIVIDFIDMREKKHNSEVEKTLKNALKMDKARVNLGRISPFGILEMSRQRIAKTINDAIHLECPHCEGRGKVKSVEAMALSFLRKVHGAAAKGNVAEVWGGLPLEVAYYLLNRKKRELAQIENDYDIEVTVKGKPSFLLNQLDLEITRREKAKPEENAHDEQSAVEIPRHSRSAEVTEERTVAVAAPDPAADAQPLETGKKRKRRRKKKKGAAEGAAAAPTEQMESIGMDDAADIASPAMEQTSDAHSGDMESPETAADQHLRKKRKRRRGSRKGGKGLEDASESSGQQASEQTIEPAEGQPDFEVSANQEVEMSVPDKPKKPTSPRNKKKTAQKTLAVLSEETGGAIEPASETPAQLEPLTPQQEKAPARKRPQRKTVDKKTAPAVELVETPAPADPPAPPKRAARPRRKKTEPDQ